jgi:threonine dehydrogenase-like Zn-dependent dehydrogenase
MKAVIFKGPGKVVIEDRPVPKIKDQTDIIVKVDKVRSKCDQRTRQLTSCRRHYAEGTPNSFIPKHDSITNITQ